MTDYYSSLNLDKNKKLDEINADLSRLESTWKRREITNPEKATTMLALIIQARKVFASDASRKTYDDELDRSQKQAEKTDPDKDRSAALNKWKKQAEEYYESGQYDLAKVAVEKALSLSSASVDDDALFALAADIYKENGNLDTAMSYINRAIVAAPNVSAYYLSKGLIYDHQASIAMQRGGYGNPVNFRVEARKMFQLADMKAEQSGDLANRARACGALAFSYYFQNPIDKKEGEDFANLAVKYGGDSWGNADKVLSDVNKRREEAEEARKKKIYDEAISLTNIATITSFENAINKLSTLNGWRDSAQKIAWCEGKIREIKEKEAADAALREQEIIRQEKDKIRKKRIIKICTIAVSIVVAVSILAGVVSNNQKRRDLYNEAVSYLEAEKYDQAINLFNQLDDYKDSNELLEEAREQKTERKYTEAIALFESRDYENALPIFSSLKSYKDSSNYYDEAKRLKNADAYAEAEKLFNTNNIYKAATAFYALDGYSDARERCFACWSQLTERNTVSAGGLHSKGFTLGVKSNGTVVTTGNNQYGQCDVGDWTKIIAVAAGMYHSVGLRSDGTVVAVGGNDDGQCDVSGWTDIVAISAYYHTVGLKADGTVVATGSNGKECDVSGWKDIIAIAAGPNRTVGLRSDGTVIAVGANEFGSAEVSDWTQIVTICTDMSHTFGVRIDGSITGAGESYHNSWLDWTDIIDVAHGCLETVGLRSDGTTVATAKAFSGWTNILMIDGRSYHIVGLRKDGTVIAAGNNESGQCDVTGWTDIMIP